jgi:hypothetical protein
MKVNFLESLLVKKQKVITLHVPNYTKFKFNFFHVKAKLIREVHLIVTIQI